MRCSAACASGENAPVSGAVYAWAGSAQLIVMASNAQNETRAGRQFEECPRAVEPAVGGVTRVISTLLSVVHIDGGSFAIHRTDSMSPPP